jgi:lipopolysaccharide export system permease protein
MKILPRYLLRQHLWPFVFALSALTSFELLRQIARRLKDLLGKGLPWTVIVEFFALTIPFLVAVTLSMSVLMAVLYTVSRLAGDHELTAMKAGGVSGGQLLRPLLLAATGVALVSFLFGDQILPRTNHRLSMLMRNIGRTKPTFSLKEHVVNEVKRGRLTLRAARIDQATYRMRDVTIYNIEEARRKRIIYADSGLVGFAANREDLQLTLYHGSMHEYDSDDPRVFQQTLFERQIVVVPGVGNEFERTSQEQFRGDRELGVCDLDSIVRQKSVEAARAEMQARTAERNGLRGLVGLPLLPEESVDGPAPPKLYCRALAALRSAITPRKLEAQEGRVRQIDGQDVPTGDSLAQLFRPARDRVLRARSRARPPEVRLFQDRAESARIGAAIYEVELQKKYSIPAACIIFVLVGVPLAMQFPRGGLGLVLGAGMVVFAIYYIGLIGGESLANRGTLSPFLAMWATNILMSGVGIAGLLWQRRQGAVPRRWGRRRRRDRAA